MLECGLRLGLALNAAVAMVAAGCGGQQASTAPTPIVASDTNPNPAPAARVIQPLRIAGRVLDDANTPVSGARVTQWDTANTATTDASGAFEMTASVTPQDRSFWVTVEKPGFETSELARNIDAAPSASLRLHQVRTMTAGESIQGVVNADDSACGYHWGFVCRRVRVNSPASGTLIVELASDSSGLGVAIAGPVGFPQPVERRISVSVKAGSEVIIDISAAWDISAPARFTLTAALAL
jgi:Carboxypeptidase regulatory-like domain